MNQSSVKYYDKKTHSIETVTQWEEEDPETGEIIHHKENKSETYRGPKFFRVFPEALRLATMALDKNSYKALFYLLPKVSTETNIASVSYSDFEAYLQISNQSVTTIMGAMQKADIIRRWKNGQWMLNPTIAAGGYELRRSELIAIYFGLTNKKCPNGINYTQVVKDARVQKRKEIIEDADKRRREKHAPESSDGNHFLPGGAHGLSDDVVH